MDGIEMFDPKLLPWLALATVQQRSKVKIIFASKISNTSAGRDMVGYTGMRSGTEAGREIQSDKEFPAKI